MPPIGRPEGVSHGLDNVQAFVNERLDAVRVTRLSHSYGGALGFGRFERRIKVEPDLPDGLTWNWEPGQLGAFTISGIPREVGVTRHQIIELRTLSANAPIYEFTITRVRRPAIELSVTNLSFEAGERIEPQLIGNVFGISITSDGTFYTPQIFSFPRLPDGVIITAYGASGQILISGRPTTPSSQIHTLTVSELNPNTGLGETLPGSANLHLTIRQTTPPPPTIVAATVAPKRSGETISTFRFATITNAQARDVTVSGLSALGLNWRLRGTALEFSGYIPEATAPRSYNISVVVRTPFDEHPTLTRTLPLRVTAPQTVLPPPEPAPPYWEGKPEIVLLTRGVRISVANPIALGYMMQVDNLDVKLSFRFDTARLPAGVFVSRRSSDGAMTLAGTPNEHGTFSALITASVAGSDSVDFTLNFEVQAPPRPEPDPMPDPMPDPDVEPTPPRTNAPPTIQILARSTSVDVDTDISFRMYRVSDPDDRPRVFVAGLPPGLGVQNGVVCGSIPTATRRGTYRITIRATDSVNPVVTANASITVRGEIPTVAKPTHENVASNFSLAQGASGGLKLLLNAKGATSTEVTGLPPDLRTNVVQLIPAANGAKSTSR